MWIKKRIENLSPVNNSLSKYVNGPKELSLILSQIGVVDSKEEALRLQMKLKVGQSLVDKRGNIWRWDGY